MTRPSISAELRERILKRDGYACRYCGSTDGPFHMDHVYPFSKGGETTYENLVTACSRCNTKKHNKVGIWPWPIFIQEPEKIVEKINSYSGDISLRNFGKLMIVSGVMVFSLGITGKSALIEKGLGWMTLLFIAFGCCMTILGMVGYVASFEPIQLKESK